MHHGTNPVIDLVTGIVLLLLISAGTTMISKRFDKLPLTILLVFVGIGIATFGEGLPGLGLLKDFHLTPELVLFVFIPTLIFESAYNLDARQVASNLWPILTLAIPGLLISTCIIGGIFSFTEFDLMVALLLGAILSATDPVAVIAIFKQLGVPERLTILVEGESLFNDATSLVLATILAGLIGASAFSGEIFVDGAGRFLFVFAGGVAVGWSMALLAGYTLGQIESDPAIEITVTTILAYFSFIIAEAFHVSGIMAVVAAGLTIGSWGKSKISPSTSEFMEHFWEYLAFIANALIFLMVGLQIDLVVLWQSIDLIALVVVAMLVSRAVVIFGVVPLVGKLPGSEPIGLPFQSVMYWGGLRGAIALAIVLSLDESAVPQKDTLITLVMGAVLFTLVVQGLSIERLVNFFKLSDLSLPDSLAKLEGDRNARQEGLGRLNSLVDGGLFSQRIADNIRERCERNLHELNAEIETLNQDMSRTEMAKVLGMRCLAREKSRTYELFSRGLINEWAFRELDHTLEVQIDEVRHRGLMPTAEIELSIGKAINLFLIRIFDVIGARWVVEKLSTSRIIRDYDVAWGRYRAANSVLHGLETIAGEGNIDIGVTEELRHVYEEILGRSKIQIDEVAEQYPEFVETIQEQLGQRLLLVAEHESVEHAADLGLLQEGIASKILKDQAARLKQLKQDDISATFEIETEEILRKVPMFQSIGKMERELICASLKPKTVPRGTDIIRQGQEGDSIFLIARGIANVEITEGDVSNRVATLYAGDFFGESALLHGTPRNATARAATPCSLYELSRKSLDRIFVLYPDIKETVEAVDRGRRNVIS